MQILIWCTSVLGNVYHDASTSSTNDEAADRVWTPMYFQLMTIRRTEFLRTNAMI